MLPNNYRLLQLGLSGLVFVLSLAVIGTAGHSLDVFRRSQSTNGWWMPLWPQHFESAGTSALLGAGIVSILCSIFHFVLIMVPRFHLINHPTLSALTVLAAAAPGAFISLSVVAYAHVLNDAAPNIDTIETWTCRYKDQTSLPKAAEADTSDVSNADFGRLCAESKFAIWTTLVICLIQCALMVLAVIGWWVMKRAQRAQAKQVNQWENYPQDVEMNGFENKPAAVHISDVTPAH